MARRCQLGSEAVRKIEAARDLIERAVAEGTPTYGVNTGFGRFVDVAIEPGDVARLQLNLLRSHACGVGEHFPTEVVRAAMLLRANALATGASGVRLETVERLLDAERPCAPGGAVTRLAGSQRRPGPPGPSGPAAGRRGGGRGGGGGGARRRGPGPGRPAPGQLGAKEGLALINGTQFMAAIGALVLIRAGRLVRIADLAAAQSVEAVRASRTPFSPEIQQLRPHPGQVDSAANLYDLLDGSQIDESHRWCGRVQDAYSLRCSPQVHGAVRDAVHYVGASSPSS